MQGYIGGIYSSDFTKYGKQFRVMIQALPNDRKSPENLNSIFVKTASGAMAPISQFVTLEKTFGPQSLERYNLFTSVGISGSSNPGFSTGDAIKAVQQVAAENLPANYTVEFTGLSKEEMKAGSQTYVVFLLSFLFVYFILASQYESYLLPFSVIISLPLGVVGAFFGQRIFGLENNIYFQIAIIMSVSYTHLDVYKRQTQRSGLRHVDLSKRNACSYTHSEHTFEGRFQNRHEHASLVRSCTAGSLYAAGDPG